MRDYKAETENRVAFIRDILRDSGSNGIIFGNSGGKDSALVAILCKKACDNTIGIQMPGSSRRNYEVDLKDAESLASAFSIQTRTVDIGGLKDHFVETLRSVSPITDAAIINISPRLRMITLYAIALSENLLVAGTGNRSEGYMGYFTKWGDGAYDFNPIGDLTVTEIYEFLTYLNAPESILKKAPSGALFDGQTDEQEMGISYASIDRFLLHGTVSDSDRIILDKFHKNSAHKRNNPPVYGA